jgi:hypothetical protein
VGSYATELDGFNQTLIEHWNGTAWKRVWSPNRGGSANDDILAGVAASSSTNIWPVGYHLIGDGERGGQPIALHCC